MDSTELLRELLHAVAETRAEVADLRALQERMFRKGVVTDVDAKKHRFRMEIGVDENGEAVKSDWIPYAQIAGKRKTHSVPSKGQQMLQLAPDGDFSQALGIPLTWSDNNPSPSTKEDEDVEVRGKTRVTQRDGSLKVEVDGVTVETTKQRKTITIHKDEQNPATVDDKHPWEGNKGDPLHKIEATKDGGIVHTVKIGDHEHKLSIHPDRGIEHSFDKGKHVVTIGGGGITHSVDNGQHQVKIAGSGIGDMLGGQLGALLGHADLGALANQLRTLLDTGALSGVLGGANGGVAGLLDGNLGTLLGNEMTSRLTSELGSLLSSGNLASALAGGITHISSMRVQVQAPQIEHNGALKVLGSILAQGAVQSVIGFKGNLQGVAGGLGAVSIPNATNWS